IAAAAAPSPWWWATSIAMAPGDSHTVVEFGQLGLDLRPDDLIGIDLGRSSASARWRIPTTVRGRQYSRRCWLMNSEPLSTTAAAPSATRRPGRLPDRPRRLDDREPLGRVSRCRGRGVPAAGPLSNRMACLR